MDALTLLKNDHDKVRELFAQAEKLSDRAKASRRDLFEQIDDELTLHTKIEEKIFYPAFKERAENSAQRDQILEAFEEHGVAKRLIKEINALEPSDERYKAKLSVLIESVRHHADEEEQRIFPMSRELFDAEELDDLGEAILQAKEKAGAPVPTAARR